MLSLCVEELVQREEGALIAVHLHGIQTPELAVLYSLIQRGMPVRCLSCVYPVLSCVCHLPVMCLSCACHVRLSCACLVPQQISSFAMTSTVLVLCETLRMARYKLPFSQAAREGHSRKADAGTAAAAASLHSSLYWGILVSTKSFPPSQHQDTKLRRDAAFVPACAFVLWPFPVASGTETFTWVVLAPALPPPTPAPSTSSNSVACNHRCARSKGGCGLMSMHPSLARS